VARHQAKGRSRTWRHRLPDLFRTRGTTGYFVDQSFPAGPVAQQGRACSAAAVMDMPLYRVIR
jgi:hypothetical protein